MDGAAPHQGFGVADWVFKPEDLTQRRSATRDRAVEALQSANPDGAGGKKSAREVPRALSLEECKHLDIFFAKKIPELCSLCSAPADVCWTALVFHRRFFVVRSPMEHDPLPVMFAAVHLACKVEEVHEITLGRLMEAADVAADEALRGKVVRLELPLLEALGFGLLVEPKPYMALRMLSQELQTRAAQGPLAKLTEEEWAKACADAGAKVLDLALHSDALFLWSASILSAACLGSVLDSRAAADVDPVIMKPSEFLMNVMGECVSSGPEGTTSSVPPTTTQNTVRRLHQECAQYVENTAPLVLTEEVMKDAVKSARKCHRVFGRGNSNSATNASAPNKNGEEAPSKKRKWGNQLKGASADPAVCEKLMDFNRKMQTSAGRAVLAGDAQLPLHD